LRSSDSIPVTAFFGRVAARRRNVEKNSRPQNSTYYRLFFKQVTLFVQKLCNFAEITGRSPPGILAIAAWTYPFAARNQQQCLH